MKKWIAFHLLILLTFFIVNGQNKPAAKAVIAKDTLNKMEVFKASNLLTDSILKGKKLTFYKKDAHASYYADKFHGRRMANGKTFDMHKMTAAHKKLPFGTKIKVTNQANKKSVVVEITDRGPFVKSREIDLSKGAFMAITHNKGGGIMKVTLEIIAK